MSESEPSSDRVEPRNRHASHFGPMFLCVILGVMHAAAATATPPASPAIASTSVGSRDAAVPQQSPAPPLPEGVPVVMVLPKGEASARALDAAAKRLGVVEPGFAARWTSRVPADGSTDPAGPWFAFLGRGEDGGLRMVVGARGKAGTPANPPAEWAVGQDGTRTRRIVEWGGNWTLSARDAESARWVDGLWAKRTPALAAEVANVLDGSDVWVRLTPMKGPPPAARPGEPAPPTPPPGISDSAALIGDVAGWATAVRALQIAELTVSPLASATVAVDVSSPAGLRVASWLTFADGSPAALWLSQVGPPRKAPFAALDFGEPALMLALDLPAKAGPDGIVAPVKNVVGYLAAHGTVLPPGFEETLLAAARKAAGSVSGITLSVGLPPPGSTAAFGIQGAIDTVPGTDVGAVAGGLAGPLGRVLEELGKPWSLPLGMTWSTGSAKAGSKAVDALELSVGGDTLAAITARGLLQSTLGEGGVRFLTAPLPAMAEAPSRTAFVLAGDAPRLEKTLAGSGKLPPSAEKRLATLPADRHLVLLASPGRLLVLGRRIQSNALRLPEWKPKGFLAVTGRFRGATAALEIDLPWEEAEALAEHARKPAAGQ